MHPTDGFWCKLWRANEHLEALNREIIAFLQPDCYEVVTESEATGNPAPGIIRSRIRRRVTFSRNPPLLYWGVLIGDIVSNLRSALDQLVYAISYSRDPATFSDDRTTEFPIHDSEAAFNRPRRRGDPPRNPIRGLPDDATAIIEGLQPYHGGPHAHAEPLRTLRELCNIDKHRGIHVATWAAYQIAWDITGFPPGLRVHSHSILPAGVIESGAIIAEMEISYPAHMAYQPVMQMDRTFQFTVALIDGMPIRALWDLAYFTEGIINTLAGFVRPE